MRARHILLSSLAAFSTALSGPMPNDEAEESLAAPDSFSFVSFANSDAPSSVLPTPTSPTFDQPSVSPSTAALTIDLPVRCDQTSACDDPRQPLPDACAFQESPHEDEVLVYNLHTGEYRYMSKEEFLAGGICELPVAICEKLFENLKCLKEKGCSPTHQEGALFRKMNSPKTDGFIGSDMSESTKLGLKIGVPVGFGLFLTGAGYFGFVRKGGMFRRAREVTKTYLSVPYP